MQHFLDTKKQQYDQHQWSKNRRTVQQHEGSPKRRKGLMGLWQEPGHRQDTEGREKVSIWTEWGNMGLVWLNDRIRNLYAGKLGQFSGERNSKRLKLFSHIYQQITVIHLKNLRKSFKMYIQALEKKNVLKWSICYVFT